MNKLFLTIILLTYVCLNTFSQCNSDAFIDNCSEDLGDYTYIKMFDIKTSKSKTKVDYSTIFNKDHEYLLVICYDTKNTDKKMIVNLLDRNKKIIQSSYYKPHKLHVRKIAFKCSATGVYYIESFFEGDTESCGLVILGFKKI